MKRIGLGIALTLLVTILVASMAMADGPGNNGYGADPGAEPPPNNVYVPPAAYDACGGELPPNPDSNGTLFYLPAPPK